MKTGKDLELANEAKKKEIVFLHLYLAGHPVPVLPGISKKNNWKTHLSD
jgi:hypothetical protein